MTDISGAVNESSAHYTQFVERMAEASKKAIIELGREGGVPFIAVWMGFVLVLLTICLSVIFTAATPLIQTIATTAMMIIIVFALLGLVDRYIKMFLAERALREQLRRFDRLTELMVANYLQGRNIEIAQLSALGTEIAQFQKRLIANA